MSGSPEPRHDHSESPRKRGPERRTVFKRLEKGVFHRLGDKEKETELSSEKRHNKRTSSRRTEVLSESEGSARGHWKSKPKRQRSSVEDDLSQPWVCEETDPFTPRVRYFDFLKNRMPSHIKTYEGNEDPKDHLKIFQAAAKTEHWEMPTWCHMFNSTLTGNARVRDGESTKEFVPRYKLECRDVKGAPECMKISRFIHGITNPELIKRLHDKISKSLNEMIKVTTTFLRGEVAASNRERKKSFSLWKQQDAGQKQNFKKGGFRNQQRSERKQDRFALLTKTPKEILELDKGKFKPPPRMTTPVEKRNARKICEFHGEVGHTTDECMHLKRQIEKMLKAGKLSHLIKELRQSSGKDQSKAAKKGKTSGKDKPLAILMVLLQKSCMSTASTDSAQREARSKENPGNSVHSPWNAKILVAGRIVTLRSSMVSPLECTMVSGPGMLQQTIDQVVEEKIQVAIHPECLKQTVAIGSTLTEEGWKEMCSLLRPKSPMLTAPKEKEELIMYLAAAKEAISAVLMTERDRKQMPIYFVSRALQGLEVNYTPMKKLILALVNASKRPGRYFQAHTKVVITDQPIKQILSNLEVTRRLLKWRFKLEEHDIHYRPRTSVKGQILADYIVERPDDDHQDTLMDDKEELPDPWILFMDGSSCIDSFRASLIIMNSEGMEFTYASRFMFNATNNEAEYEALIAGLRIAKQMGVEKL
uniref:Reverse transcriptase domain-containing protein n=1 Tax=Tanacetum cinerariifolium TaxID=118510 RepID=A0A6L2KKF8_TANCI|nr:reverse transcriptase domain-containing protein [Tanacetum cinerariifolium]